MLTLNYKHSQNFQWNLYIFRHDDRLVDPVNILQCPGMNQCPQNLVRENISI